MVCRQVAQLPLKDGSLSPGSCEREGFRFGVFAQKDSESCRKLGLGIGLGNTT